MALFTFLALYAWNARTRHLDALAELSGLRIMGYILQPVVWGKNLVTGIWRQYFALVGIAEENERLRGILQGKDYELASIREELAELPRLRALVTMPPPDQWQRLGAHVLTGRFGPASALESIMIDRGFASGATPGVPVVNHVGAVGRVLRAAPNAATVLLLTDRTFRIPVISQSNRISGILAGMGSDVPLEMRHVPPTAVLKPGDILVSSGLDGYFPKGIPVARVTSFQPSSESLFPRIQAHPIVSLTGIEEVLLLAAPQRILAQKPRFLVLPETSGNKTAAAVNGTERRDPPALPARSAR